jgi:hypothetical protein
MMKEIWFGMLHIRRRGMITFSSKKDSFKSSAVFLPTSKYTIDSHTALKICEKVAIKVSGPRSVDLIIIRTRLNRLLAEVWPESWEQIAAINTFREKNPDSLSKMQMPFISAIRRRTFQSFLIPTMSTL